ncbi:hypothetical protein BC937DRAFT_87172 [Endogone sp. FLAS-F59071]|nr:hypothetical protein BC937DRAFT_87172 [Endogone sp. FLAS-F59071]|eukprot:RUS22757.1 hypothetical protein BC937DRAFT_87172 [Endogone sp. FLAS-F59071]
MALLLGPITRALTRRTLILNLPRGLPPSFPIPSIKPFKSLITTTVHPRRAFVSTPIPTPTPTPSTTPAEKPAGRVRALLRQYGAPGVAVYLTVSAMNLGLTFLAVQSVGADGIKRLEDWLSSTFGRWALFQQRHPEGDEARDWVTTSGPMGAGEISAERGQHGDQPSIASVFVVAYGIHKTLLLPVRVGLTAIITPILVRRLKAIGWNVGRAAGRA